MNTSPAPVPVVPEGTQLAHLAMELATRILPLDDICRRYEITRPQLAHLIRADRQFAHRIRECRHEWNSPMNARARLKLKAELAAEDGLLTLYGLFRDVNIPPPSRLDAYRQIAQLADVIPKKDTADTGTKFVFTISLGDTPAERVTITGTELESQPLPDSDSSSSISIDFEDNGHAE